MTSDPSAPFSASAAHRAALRQLRFIWIPAEAGAPAVDPWQPFGTPDPLGDLAAIAGTRDEAALRRLYAETMHLLPAFVAAAAAGLPPGRYTLAPDDVERLRAFMPGAAFVADGDDFDDDPAASAESGVADDGSFEYTADHGLVLPQLAWETAHADGQSDDAPLAPEDVRPAGVDRGAEDEEDGPTWPVPIGNPKRPYGDMTSCEIDIAGALGIPVAPGPTPFPEPVLARLTALHHSTPAALRVLVQHGQQQSR